MKPGYWGGPGPLGLLRHKKKYGRNVTGGGGGNTKVGMIPPPHHLWRFVRTRNNVHVEVTKCMWGEEGGGDTW